MSRRLLAAFVAVAIGCSFLGEAAAQRAGGRRDTPTASFYNIIYGPYFDGDYSDAFKGFQSESRGAIKTSQSRWIDSICYETMCGECYFQMGAFERALGHFTNALQLYEQFPDWMTKVQFTSQAIRPAAANARKAVPWGSSTRQTRLGSYPDSEKILQVTIDTNQTMKRGQMVQQGMYYPITPQEIVRCTCLALRRRATILGPVAKFDPLNNKVVAALGGSVGQPNHWSNVYIDIERGLAMIAAGREGQGVPYLQRSILAGGEFDHSLTSVVLLELGRQALARGEYPAASKFFEEATFAAVNYPDYAVLEEAFRYATTTHLMANNKGFYAPLLPAIQWAKAQGLRQLRASLLLCAAESYAAIGETKQAAAMLDEARVTIGRRKMIDGHIGARLNYLCALVAFEQRRQQDGNQFLDAAMAYMQHGSLRLFQINMADGLYTSGDASARSALDLFNEVLRDPTAADWGQDPMESFAVLTTPQPAAMEHWFEAAMERRDTKEVQNALEIAERTRRRRFFNSLEFGGRLESLRWTLEAPAAQLPSQSLLQRQDILSRYPEYAQLARQSQAIRDALSKQPLTSDDPVKLKDKSRQLGELASIGVRQEAILREIALKREPVNMVFPPFRTVAEVQKSLPDKHAVLVFFVNGRNLYGFLLNNERFSHWRVSAPTTLLPQIQAFLRDMGQVGQNHELNVKDLTDTKWKQSGRKLLDTLLKDSSADFSQPFDELVIVPDGILWYVPFDALQVVAKKKSQALISRFRIRYAPTLSLSTSASPGRNASGNMAVVVGKLYPRDEVAAAQAAFDKLAESVPGAVAVRPPAPAPASIFGAIFHRLVVFDDLTIPEDPFGWNIAPIERGKQGATLADWLLLPWGAPDVVVLPGFHTAAEDGLKRPRRGAIPGNEVFLSVCGLMANGSRTLLLSRWRTGGQTSFDIVREFVQELPHTSPADAWQRAVLLAMESRLNFESEPRVKHNPTDEAPSASHPFFWAGYMLVDSGTMPNKDEPPPAGLAPKPKDTDKPAATDEPKEGEKDKSAKEEEPKKETKDKPAKKDETKKELKDEPAKKKGAKDEAKVEAASKAEPKKDAKEEPKK